jgi:hypothetical protein
MGHILYLVPIWALATAWLYFLTRLAPALDVAHEVSEMVIVVDLNLENGMWSNTTVSHEVYLMTICNEQLHVLAYAGHLQVV